MLYEVVKDQLGEQAGGCRGRGRVGPGGGLGERDGGDGAEKAGEVVALEGIDVEVEGLGSEVGADLLVEGAAADSGVESLQGDVSEGDAEVYAVLLGTRYGPCSALFS